MAAEINLLATNVGGAVPAPVQGPVVATPVNQCYRAPGARRPGPAVWASAPPQDDHPCVLRGPVRAENLVRSCDQRSCPHYRPAMMITGHVPAVRLPPDHAADLVAAADRKSKRLNSSHLGI